MGDGHLKTDPEKVEAMAAFVISKTRKQFRRFLSRTNWCPWFIFNYTTIVATVHDCLAQDRIQKFSISGSALATFHQLKRCLITALVLVAPDFKEHFYIQCDAST